MRIAPLHIASTTSFSVVPVALPIARMRCSGQSWAANRRDAVISRLRIVLGGRRARSVEVSLRRLLLRVWISALGDARPRRRRCPARCARRSSFCRRTSGCSAASWALPALELRWPLGPRRRDCRGRRDRSTGCSAAAASRRSVHQGVVQLGVHREPAVTSPSIGATPRAVARSQPGAVQPRDSANSSRIRPGRGSAEWRTWCSRSIWSSSTHIHSASRMLV